MKIIKKNIKIVMVLLLMFLASPHAKAAINDTKVSFQKIEGVYFFQQDNITGKTMANAVTKLYADGELAYCIEPLVQITTFTYSSTTDWSITNLSDEQKEYIELAGYFGREYPSHNNDKYWMAAQELIWEKAKNISVKFTTQNNGNGEEIDITKEKDEINNLINNYKKTPSFANTTLEGNMNETITIVDNNEVLNNYNFSYNGKHQVVQKDNKLEITFTPNEINEEEITFERKSYDNKSTVIYYNNNTQTYAKLRITNKQKFSIKLKSNGATLKINKKGEKLELTNASYQYNIIALPNVTFAVYANEDITDSKGNIIYKKYSLINTLTTDNNGIATLSNLYYGKYFLLECETSSENMLNNEKYYFEFTKQENLNKEINLQNYLPKGNLKFTKTDYDNGNPISNTVIQLFTENDRLIGTYTTNNEGKVSINNLPLGKYYIIEKSASNGYLLSNEKIYLNIKENGQKVNAQMKNKKETITINVPNTKKDKPFFQYITLIIGILGILYVCKKNNNRYKTI